MRFQENTSNRVSTPRTAAVTQGIMPIGATALLLSVLLLNILMLSGCRTASPCNVSATEIKERYAVMGGSSAEAFTKYKAPEFLTLEELGILSTNPVPEGALAEKLENFWKTPIICNEAYYEGYRAQIARNDTLGSFISVTTWNLEWSIFVEQALQAMSSEEGYKQLISSEKAPEGSSLRKDMLRQRERLANSDIILLQEMDIGMPRSRYVNAAEEMARSLHMNYTFGTQSIEVDPVLTGYAQKANTYGSEALEVLEPIPIDRERYKGVFGSAVLSRYPIKHVETFQLKHKPYDWYTGESGKASLIELGRRKGAKILFREGISRELKVGARNYFRVDLEVPGVPGNTLTIINIHLEIKCPPKDRAKQIEEILGYIKDIKNPVILAGDFNSAPGDISAISVPKIAKNTATSPSTYVSIGTRLLLAYGNMVNLIRTTSNQVKNFYRPLAMDIPILMPNKSKPMFNRIKDFQFDDGGTFDFRGDINRSINGKKSILSNSNQKGHWGQVTSFEVLRPIGPLGKQRLDWFFVKSNLTNPTDRSGSYTLAPHFGETLVNFNMNLNERISDHHPSIIDLPLDEPDIPKESETKTKHCRHGRPYTGPRP